MIKQMTENVMVKGCINFAKEAGVEASNSQLMIFAKDDDAEPSYKSMILGQGSREVTFNEILNTKVDLLGREALSKPTIQQCLKNFAQELGVSPTSVKIVIYEQNKRAGLALYKGAQMVRPVSLDEIFKE